MPFLAFRGDTWATLSTFQGKDSYASGLLTLSRLASFTFSAALHECAPYCIIDGCMHVESVDPILDAHHHECLQTKGSRATSRCVLYVL